MTKTLKHRFVFSAMTAVTVLLLFLIGAINTVTHIMVNDNIDSILTELVNSNGSYSPPKTSDKHARREEMHMLPDAVMGARFFMVFYNHTGEVVRTDVSHIYAVSTEQAQEIGQCVDLDSPGMYEQFRYTSAETPDGRGKFAVFLDVSIQHRFINTVLLASCGGGVLCWAIMLLLVLLLSRMAISPVAQGIEKQKQFVTNAGHELKTPLAIILTNTDALELHNGESKWSKNIRAQALRLNGLMQNLLTLSKMDESTEKLPVTQILPGVLLSETLELYESAAEGKNITLHAAINSELTCKANKESIVQLFSILLDNAVKYTPENGEIFLQLQKQDSHILLRIENPWEHAGHEDPELLFDRFYRGDTARTQSGGGYGIGLSAARAIVAAHGGTIKASENNGNIVFTVRL